MLLPEKIFFDLDYQLPDSLKVSEQVEIKNILEKYYKIYSDPQAFLEVEDFLKQVIIFAISSLPKEIIEAGGSNKPSSLYIEAGELTKKPRESCDWLFRFCFNDDIQKFGLFELLQNKLLNNIQNASGILKRDNGLEPEKWIFPEDSALTGTALFSEYLVGH